jgi:hypothetical protein
MDAMVWAQQFYDHGWRVWKESGGVERDQIGLMLGWFSNAIMAGYDTAALRSAPPQTPMTDAELRLLWLEFSDQFGTSPVEFTDIARAVERHHGICPARGEGK